MRTIEQLVRSGGREQGSARQSSGFVRLQAWVTLSVLALLTLFVFTISTVRSQSSDAGWYMVRAIDAADLGLSHPVGLSYSPAASVFIALGRPDGTTAQPLGTFTPMADPAGANMLAAPVADPLSIVFVPGGKMLLALDTAGTLTQFVVGDRAMRPPDRQNVQHATASALQLGRGGGVAVDEAGGRMFLLDSATRQLVEVQGDPSNLTALAAGSVRRIGLGALGNISPRGLAYNPANGHLYTIDPAGATLYEMTIRGRVIEQYDLSTEMTLADPQGMVFAPSADPTDDPAAMNLFLADSGGDRNRGQIFEISFAPLAGPPLPAAPVTLTQIIDTSKTAWNPSSPDPAGIAYRPSNNQLYISDSEVEESHPDFQGYNVFSSTTGGSLTGFCTTTSFSSEPTGMSLNPANEHFFFSDDNTNRIYEVDLVDGVYCNGNDIVVSINVMTLFGIDDAEDVAYAPGLNSVFISGGVSQEVYRIGLGPDGVIGGGNETMPSHFDVSSMGLRDPEGIEYDTNTGHLFVVSTNHSDDFMLEMTITGTVITNYDLTALGRIARSGLALAPGSDTPAEWHMYMVSRGVDNGADPNENDGKIFEIDFGGGPSNTPTPTNTPVNTNTPTNTPVNTNTPTNTPVSTNTPTNTPVSTNTPTNTPVSTNTPTPTNTPVNTSTPTATVPASSSAILISLLEPGPTTVGTLAGVRDEDIITYNGSSWSMVFDGSDVGLSSEIDDFHLFDSDTILLSLASDLSVPGLGVVDESDIIRFDATSLGANTAGAFSLYFDGSDVGLTNSNEDVDALSILSDGRILVSTVGDASVPGLLAADEDLMAFTPTSLGATTAGSWALYFDGSDVGLTGSEDIDGATLAANGDMYLSTAGGFTVPGRSGADEDVFICKPTSLGNNTACTYVTTLAFDGSVWGLGGNDVDGVELP